MYIHIPIYIDLFRPYLFPNADLFFVLIFLFQSQLLFLTICKYCVYKMGISVVLKLSDHEVNAQYPWKSFILLFKLLFTHARL